VLIEEPGWTAAVPDAVALCRAAATAAWALAAPPVPRPPGETAQGVAIVRVGETRLMYPLLADFSGAVMSLLTGGDKKVMIDLSKVTYVDSATIGCLMDLYRQTTAAGGQLRLAGVNKRVETMLTMTGAHNFLKMFPDEAGALASFGG